MSYCAACGHDNLDDAKFCEVCGAAQEAPVTTPQPEGSSASSSPNAVPSLTEAVSSAASQAARLGGNKTLTPIIAAVVVAIALFVGYNTFLKPMDAREYEKTVEDLTEDVTDAQNDAYGAIEDYYYNDLDGDESEEVDADDWKDVSADYRDNIKEARVALGELKGLRAPKKYESEQKDLEAGAIAISEVLDEWDTVIAEAPGQDIGDVWGDFTDAAEDMWSQNGDFGDFWESYNEIVE